MSLDNKVVDLADLKVSHDYLLEQDGLLSDRIDELGSGIDGVESIIGDLSNLSTTLKDSIVSAINEVLQTGGRVKSVNSKTGDVVLKTSDLTNDSGYLTSYTETDPTVPSWAKQVSKPTYTAQEVGASSVEDMNSEVNTRRAADAQLQSQITALGNGAPIPVETVAEMIDNTKAYLYTGAEVGWLTGYWYTYDSAQAKFVPRGEYGVGTVIDNTLTVSGDAADAKATGDAISEVNGRLQEYDSIVYTEGGGESGEISGQIIQFDSSDGTPEAIGVDGSGVTSGNLTVCGVNLHPKHAGGSASGLTWTVDNDGVISFTGTPTADVLIRLRDIYIPTVGLTYAVALFNNMTNSRLTFFGVTPTNTNNFQLNLTATNSTRVQTSTTNIVEFRLRIPKDVDWTGLTIKPMFVVGSTVPTEFIPYSGQTYAVTLGTDGKVAETISYKTGINTIFSDFGDVTAYMPVERRTIKEDFEALSEVVEKGNSLYKYEVSGNGKYLYIAYKSGENWVRWQLHNVPAPNSNSDTWQIGRVCGLDGNFENLVELVRGGEFELAIREHGAADYCGGNNHGDETTNVFKLFIDGKPITDLSTLPGTYTPFTRIDAFEIATVNRCDTPAEDIVKHQKVWIFEDGKVKIRQTLKFLEQLSVDVAMVCMCAALRSAFPYGIRKGGVAIEDMTTATYTKVYTTATDIFYEYYGDKATCKVHAKTDNPNNTSVMWINNTSDLNKLYYGYFGITNSANPTTVPVNTVITAESVYEVAYTA